MLVLTRLVGESIVIGDPPIATITIVRVTRPNNAGETRVRVGVRAAPEVRVDRSKVRAARLAAQAGGQLAP